ncbi:hypothetical protein APHAL10511_004615 [Amanita phalloides]|nr:hypothetical protein APHAL10511_004615 [Amanita phalloides]
MPPPENQYHHYIPRFILRLFKIPESLTPQQKKNRKRRGQKQKEEIYCYDLGCGKLETRSIARVYGITNLYKDARNPENAHHLEEKLSVLENHAATVIRKIHDSVGDGSFQIERRELDSLRKFIQIMCYRKQTFYFDEEHPENAGMEFLKHLRESKGLDNPIEVWLHFLDYFLNTPHNDIINRAAEFQKKNGTFGISTMLEGTSWPTNVAAEDFIAHDYNHLADHFYVSVVEAAAGTEFIMSNNTFGLWEGTMDWIPDAHRLFIVGPRIALILRCNLIGPNSPLSKPMVVRSTLIDIPLDRVQIRYASGRQSMTMEQLLRHRASPAGQRDQVKFKIVKLTKRQTQNVNTIVLLNARRNGSVTFLSKGIMRKVLESYMELGNPHVVETKTRYIALIDRLADGDDVTPSDRHIGTDGRSQRSDDRNPELDGSFTLSEMRDALPEALSSADYRENGRLKALFNDIRSGKISCKSDYDCAYQIYRAISKDCEEEDAGQYVLKTIGVLQPIVIDRALRSKEKAIKSSNGIIHANPYAELVQTLPVNHSVKVIATVKALYADAPVPPYHDPEIKDVLYDAMAVGLLHGFMNQWSYVLSALLPGISLLQ